jgi:hypothetical protein
MLFLVGVNAENQSVNWLTSLLPNLQRATYTWLLHDMLPLFIGPAVHSIETVISDGDRQLTDSLDHCIDTNRFPPKCVRLLCFWHTICLPINNELGYLGEDFCAWLKVMLKIIARTSSITEVNSLWDEIDNTLTNKFDAYERTRANLVLQTIRSKSKYWCCGFNLRETLMKRLPGDLKPKTHTTNPTTVSTVEPHFPSQFVLTKCA